MNADILQYYNSLQDKDSEGIRYFFDIVAVNQQSGMQNTLCSVQQAQKKATGAERFKELVERAERQKYNLVNVKEYAADGQTVVNNLKFRFGRAPKKQGQRPMPPAQLAGFGSFEDGLERLGFTDGLLGVIDASAQKLNNEYILKQQSDSITDLKTRLALCEQRCEQLKNETETYKERYKEILDEKKTMERDHKYEVQQLTQKSQLGTMALQAGLGLLAQRTPLGGILNGLMGAAPTQPQQGAAQAGDDDDDDEEDDDVVLSSVPEEARKYHDYIVKYAGRLSTQEMQKLATICQYAAMGGLESAYAYCVSEYQKQKQNSQGNE